MKHYTIIFGIVFFFGCDSKRHEVLEQQAAKAGVLVSIGDNIYEAKTKLQAEGFRVEYGPDYPAKNRKYLMMIVDYGVGPSALETFQYTVGIESGSKPLDGIIKASPDGAITSIE